MERVTLWVMKEEATYPQRFADAVAEVVEEARWDARIPSIRELARLSGMTHTALNARAKKSTPYTVKDLAVLAPALKVEPLEIVRRARDRLDGGGTVTAFPTRKPPSGTPIQKKASRPRSHKPKMGED